MRKSMPLVFVAIVMTAGPVLAQDHPRLPGPGPVPVPSLQGPLIRDRGQSAGGAARPGPPSAGTVSLELESVDIGKPVLNAPYSAEAITEVVQTLADGNRIEQRTSAVVARDSRGRTRREQHGIALGALVAQAEAPIVTITDPTAGTQLNLNQDAKIARRSRSIGSFSSTLSKDVGAGMAAGDAGFASGESSPQVRTRRLGTKEVEGVRAEGTERTITIPAGAMGNALPMQIVSERWYSPDLKVVVMTRRIDPRFGETRFRLTNIVREEPPGQLFEVPSGFRIEDQQRPPEHRIRPDER
jgi:hypothetical protein